MPRMKVETSATPQQQTRTIVEAPEAKQAEVEQPKVEQPEQPAPAPQAPPVVHSKPKLHVDPAPEPEEPQEDAAPKPAAKAEAKAKPKTTTKTQAKPASSSTKSTAKPKTTAQPKTKTQIDSAPVDNAPTKSALEQIQSVPRSANGWVHRTFPGHEHAFYGACIALFLALLTFAIGPIKVFFLCLVVLIGIAIGQVFDGNPVIVRAIRDLFEGDRGQQ